MMRIAGILIFIMASSYALNAQRFSIEGVLNDSTGAPLSSATVLVLHPKDSSLVNFSASDVNGRFIIGNLNFQKLLLKITFVGYAVYSRIVEPQLGTDKVDVGVITLVEQSRQLNEITVTSEAAPVVLKKDTVEFNAGSFKTKENAMVEDLLKKLPGVEVDNDGTIRAQGKEVERVTVDGKNFFGTDPKLATRNLPADAVSKVQVFDKKSDQSAFTGIDDGQKQKTINLELKEEKRKGAFGQISAGIGEDWKYNGKASINKFRKGKQLSFLGMGNNVNEQGFGIDDYMNFTGGSQAMMSGRGAVRIEISDENQNSVPLNFGNRPNGLMTSYAGGVNFNKDVNMNTEINSSYFYNHLDHNTADNLFRQSFFSTGRIDYTQSSNQDNSNDNHRANFSIDEKIDSMNSLKLTGSLSYNETSSIERSNGQLLDDEGTIVNSSSRTMENSGTTARLTSSLLWRHKFAKKGRTFSTNVQYSGSLSDRIGYQDSHIFNGDREDRYLQRNEQEIDNNTFSTSVSYTEPLGKRKYLEANYSYSVNQNAFSRSVFDLLENEPVKNDSISTSYSSAYEFHRAGLNYRINRRNYNVTAGASVQNASLNGMLEVDDVRIHKSFQNLLPVLRINYNFTDSKDIRLEYETSVQEPGIKQLQPVVDNSDPLNLYVGNPELRPAYSHEVRANFGSFNAMTMMNIFAFLEASYVTNAITVSQSINDRGVRLSRPVNVKDGRNIQANASFGFPIQKLKSRIGVTSNARWQQGLTLVDDLPNKTIEKTIGGRIRYDFMADDVFDIGLMANISRQTAEFDLEYQEDQLYFNNTYTADVNLTFLKNYSLNSAFEYLDYTNKTNGFTQSVPLWNISVSRFLLKGNSGELKLAVQNVLDKNVGISQSAGLNYIERRQANALGRYVMVSFIYSLNKQLNPLGMRPRGARAIRMIR
jgi:hypothetical protein